MTKDVLISITGFQAHPGEEPEKIEVITNGSYYKKKNTHYLLYEEMGECSHEVVKNIAKFDDSSFYLQKSGYTNVNMSFEENKRNITNYITPFGSMLIGVDANKVNINENENKISVDIDYSLDVNCEFLADCNLHMSITAKNGICEAGILH